MHEGIIMAEAENAAINNSNKFIAFAFSGLDVAFLSLSSASVSPNSLFSFFFFIERLETSTTMRDDVSIVFGTIFKVTQS